MQETKNDAKVTDFESIQLPLYKTVNFDIGFFNKAFVYYLN